MYLWYLSNGWWHNNLYFRYLIFSSCGAPCPENSGDFPWNISWSTWSTYLNKGQRKRTMDFLSLGLLNYTKKQFRIPNYMANMMCNNICWCQVLWNSISFKATVMVLVGKIDVIDSFKIGKDIKTFWLWLWFWFCHIAKVVV